MEYGKNRAPDKRNIPDLVGDLVCPAERKEYPCQYNQSCTIYHNMRTHETLSRVTKLIEDNIKRDLKL